MPLRPNEPVQRSQTVPTFSQQPAFGKSAALKSAPVLDDKLDDEEAMKERMTLFYRVVMTGFLFLVTFPFSVLKGKIRSKVPPDSEKTCTVNFFHGKIKTTSRSFKNPCFWDCCERISVFFSFFFSLFNQADCCSRSARIEKHKDQMEIVQVFFFHDWKMKNFNLIQ